MIETSRGSLYTGITTDVARRFEEHRQTHLGQSALGARYFRAQEPVAVVYRERLPDQASAARREWQIKQLSARQKRALVADHARPDA
jgi:putative endonuclease